MKRILSAFLCICMLLGLWACNPDGGETTAPRESTETTALTEETEPVSLATVPSPGEALSEESILEYPQLGEYAESVLLANVPNQASAVLLSLRSDGTVDYIFSSLPLSKRPEYGVSSIEEAGLQYYTISPEGEATLQPADWLTQLEEALSPQLEEFAKGGESPVCWMKFSAWEGEILIFTRVGSRTDTSTYAALFRLKDNVLTQVPFSLTNKIDGKFLSMEPGTVYGIYAAKDCFVVYGATTLENVPSCNVFSYDGTFLERRMMPDSLSLAAVGPGTAWIMNEEGYQLSKQSLSDFTEMASYPLEAGFTSCSSVTPDGSAAYLMRYSQEDYAVHLLRFGLDGVDPVAKNPTLYTFGAYSSMPTHLAAANDGSFYAWADESGRGVLRWYRYNPEGAREPQIATVYSLKENRTVRTAVTLWNRTHEDIIFEYVVAAGEIKGTALTLEDAITQLNTQLVNGQGPDVLILDGLPVDSLMDKGFLHPLSGLDTTGVYPKLLEPFTMDGTLYAIPGKMTPYLVGREMGKTEPVESLEGFADYIESATRVLHCTNGFLSAEEYNAETFFDAKQLALYYVDIADDVFDLWYPAWWDAIWEGGSFHPEAYQAFLTGTGRLVTHYSLGTFAEGIEYRQKSGENSEFIEFLYDKFSSIINRTDVPYSDSGAYAYCLAANNFVGMFNFCPGTYLTDETLPCEIVGIPGPDGTGAAVLTCIASVREGGNTEAGIGLVQLLLSDEVQLSVSNQSYGIYTMDGYPVKWSCTPALLQKTAENFEGDDFQIENDFEAVLSSLRPVIPDVILDGATREATLRYYEGKLTAQEASDQVAEATAIYLAEHRQ